MSRENPTFGEYKEATASKAHASDYQTTVDRQVVTSIKGALFSDPEAHRILDEHPLRAATCIAVESPEEMEVVVSSLASEDTNGLISRIEERIQEDSGTLRVDPQEVFDKEPEFSTMILDVRNGIRHVLRKANERVNGNSND